MKPKAIEMKNETVDWNVYSLNKNCYDGFINRWVNISQLVTNVKNKLQQFLLITDKSVTSNGSYSV